MRDSIILTCTHKFLYSSSLPLEEVTTFSTAKIKRTDISRIHPKNTQGNNNKKKKKKKKKKRKKEEDDEEKEEEKEKK